MQRQRLWRNDRRGKVDLLVGGGSCAGVRVGNPGAEHVESVLSRRARFGRVQGESESGVGQHVDALIAELEVADQPVAEQLDAGADVADVVRRPPLQELRASGDELTDQVVELLVVRIATYLGPQDRDARVSSLIPVR